jgi:hypothetical protein
MSAVLYLFKLPQTTVLFSTAINRLRCSRAKATAKSAAYIQYPGDQDQTLGRAEWRIVWGSDNILRTADQTQDKLDFLWSTQ